MASAEFIESCGNPSGVNTISIRKMEIGRNSCPIGQLEEYYLPQVDDAHAAEIPPYASNLLMFQPVCTGKVKVFEEHRRPLDELGNGKILNNRRLRSMVLSGGMDEGVRTEDNDQICGVIIEPKGLPVTSPKS